MNSDFPVFNEFGKISLPTPKIQSSGLGLNRILLISLVILAVLGLIAWFINLSSKNNISKETDSNQNNSKDFNSDMIVLEGLRYAQF